MVDHFQQFSGRQKKVREEVWEETEERGQSSGNS